MTGPGSVSVLANMVLHSELHVNWVADCIGYLDAHGALGHRGHPAAVTDWADECTDRAAAALMPTANSWYVGANVPGRPRVFMPFVGGFGVYGADHRRRAAAGLQGIRAVRRRAIGNTVPLSGQRPFQAGDHC